mmetsp:Transcript_4464/g.12400  ORF Transcript_4464/g.12400 Transcript_4464/m.12400 type:complete len:203 (-) Transcript_4464:2446-3054(-)
MPSHWPPMMILLPTKNPPSKPWPNTLWNKNVRRMPKRRPPPWLLPPSVWALSIRVPRPTCYLWTTTVSWPKKLPPRSNAVVRVPLRVLTTPTSRIDWKIIVAKSANVKSVTDKKKRLAKRPGNLPGPAVGPRKRRRSIRINPLWWWGLLMVATMMTMTAKMALLPRPSPTRPPKIRRKIGALPFGFPPWWKMLPRRNPRDIA